MKNCLKENVSPLDMTSTTTDAFIVDGGWLVHQLKWEKGHTWGNIINAYVQYVQYLGRHSKNIVVVFDGYENS